MRYFKITFTEDNATDSMAFAAEDEKGAFAQLEELCGEIPRKLLKSVPITEAEYKELSGEE